jgi:ABC-type uncharacterized transport system substrate-binding protein
VPLRSGSILLALAAAGACPSAAHAHPHVFVEARAEIVFDPDGTIAAIRHVWRFDEAFTAFAVEGLDVNGDGAFGTEELDSLAKVNMDSLSEFDFFTYVIAADEAQPLAMPVEYWLDYQGDRLTLFYTLPLAAPVPVDRPVTIQVFDPEFFVAFDYVRDTPVTLVGAPAGCDATFTPPGEMDVQTMLLLSQIPAEQRNIPPDLRDAVSAVASTIAVSCR